MGTRERHRDRAARASGRPRGTVGAVAVLALITARSVAGGRADAATTFTVTTTADGAVDGEVTLREAIAAAAPSDVIDFAPGVAGTITLDPTLGALEITTALTIDGPGADVLTIDAESTSRVFEVRDSVSVRIDGLTLTNGYAPPADDAGAGGAVLVCNSDGVVLADLVVIGSDADGRGGGIFADGESDVTITGGTIGGSVPNRSAGPGGGVAYGSSWGGCPELESADHDGRLLIVSTTIDGNLASGGGGLYSDADVTIDRSSILRNTAHAQAGGILFHGSYFDTASTMTIVNSTISGNSAPGGGAIVQTRPPVATGSALVLSHTTITDNHAGDTPGIVTPPPGEPAVVTDIANTIISGNGEAGTDDDVSGPVVARFSVLGLADPDAAMDDTNVYTDDPGLGDLALNGGTTLNHLPMTGSVAIDAGDPSGAPATDQRGATRVSGVTIDIGSVEVQVPPPPTTTTTTPTSTTTVAAQQTPFCDPAPEDGFTDVPATNVHEANVDCIASLAITSGGPGGLSPTSYGPALLVSRAQMASYVARSTEVAGVVLPAAPPDAFDDDDGLTHELRINQLAAAGVVHGTGPRTYGPTQPVHRDQMATFLAHAWQLVTQAALPAGSDAFADDDGNVHEPAINRLATAGIVQGVASGRYEPSGTVARDQMATFLVNVLRNLHDAGQLG